MKKNNKGFTMIELLAVITLMGILMVVAVPAVMKYVTKGRNTSMDTMLKSSYEAAENYIMDNNILINAASGDKEIPIKTLVDQQYLEALVDPIGTEDRCDQDGSSKVLVKYDDTTAGDLVSYRYEVSIVCPQSGTYKYVYPKEDLITTFLDSAAKYAKDTKLYDEITSDNSKTLGLGALVSASYLSEDKFITKNSCTNSSSVKIEKEGNHYQYTVNLTCDGKTTTNIYAF